VARIEHVRKRRVVRPLRTTFSTSAGQKQSLHSIIVSVTLDDDVTGAGEIPTSFAYPAETLEKIRRVLSDAAARLKGAHLEERACLIEALREDYPQARMTLSGLDVALFRASLRREGVSEYGWWGRASTRIETDITIPIQPDEAISARWLDSAIQRGFVAYKLKVGGRVEQDKTLLSLVYRMLSARCAGFRLRLDGNQGFSPDSYLDFLKHLERMHYEIELFEQPLRKDDFRGLEAIRGKSPFPVLLDESVASLDDARRVIDNGLGDGINVKIAKSGVGQSLEIAQAARGAGMRLMIGCMIETMVGLSAAMFFALGTGYFDYIDLDSIHFLYGRNEYPGLSVAGPIISVDE
jgi:L-alanine-DL-glutamate epimerase-like enolase superfamily enzyme